MLSHWQDFFILETEKIHKYSKEHTKDWSAKVASFDAYVFVTAEYNHSIPGALKNAFEFLYKEWNNKAAGFVSYGSAEKKIEYNADPVN